MKKNAFTLAEVLTTLMVIGVVAAMTIPTLMNSTNDQQLKVAYKKAMSVLGQGVQLMTAKEVECPVTNSYELAKCFNDKVLSGTLTDGNNGNGGPRNVIVTSDGMAYWFYYNSEQSTNPGNSNRTIDAICGDFTKLGSSVNDWNGTNAACAVIVDLNGLKKGTKTLTGDYDGHPEILYTGKNNQGEEQQPILITGNGVRPIYNKSYGVNTKTNKGYAYIYGAESKPVE